MRTSVWLDGTAAGPAGSARRSPQPSGLDRDRIVDATVGLLDADGLAKFSMRRLAGRLGVTAMSVYWYVDTKDDLLELALDAVFAELGEAGGAGGAGEGGEGGEGGEADDEAAAIAAPTDWRCRLRTLAHGYRAVLVRHPWVTTLIGNYLNVGPRSMEFAAAVRQVVRETGLPPERQRGAIGAVFQFVYGFGTIEGHFRARCAAAGMTQDEYVTEAMGRIRHSPGVQGRLERADGPVAARGDGTVQELREQDFEVALDLLVAGLEATTERP